MTKLVCLYWVPGSAGELVNHLLLATEQYANQYVGTINAQGRSLVSHDPELCKHFPAPNNVGWYNRNWTVQDLKTLQQIADKSQKPYIVATHKRDQFDLIRSSINDCVSFGITYETNLYPAVIKNWCLKASESSTEINTLYNQSHAALGKKFQEKGLFPAFMLTEILNHIDNIPKQVLPEFDVNVNLGDLLNADLSALSGYINDQSVELFQSWYQRQDSLYKFKFDCNSAFVDALGYNYQASAPCESDIELSYLDQILILHYCKKHNLPPQKFKTHTQAANFFKNQYSS